jgi:hypothetical protein
MEADEVRRREERAIRYMKHENIALKRILQKGDHMPREDHESQSADLLPRLAEPDRGNSAYMLRDQMIKSMDSATVHIVNQLDDLVKEIEHLKQGVIQKTADGKTALNDLFNLGAEALAFGERVRSKLNSVANGNLKLLDEGQN